MKVLEIVDDNRSGCKSILTTMKLSEYRSITEEAFKNQGNISGQRDVIKRSSTAAKIRKRMIDDFKQGCIFPQVVVGLLLKPEDLVDFTEDSFEILLSKVDRKNISIIDGMQRTNIYFNNSEGEDDRNIRVEFWCSDESIKLLYRMLVLNTGQVPWNTRRQIEVVFDGLSDKILGEITKKDTDLASQIYIKDIDDSSRRKTGMFKKSSVIEMYLGFNTRKVNVDVSDELADEFQRFDMMEAVDDEANFEIFIKSFYNLCKLDFAFSKATSEVDKPFATGQELFRSDTACLGFIVSCAEYILGKNGIERDEGEKERRANEVDSQVDVLIKKISEEPNSFVNLEGLNEIIGKLPRTKIGDSMRYLFKKAFTEMLRCENLNEVPSMETFWSE